MAGLPTSVRANHDDDDDGGGGDDDDDHDDEDEDEDEDEDHTYFIEGSLEVKLPTIWRDEKQSRAEAERRGRLEERRSEEKE